MTHFALILTILVYCIDFAKAEGLTLSPIHGSIRSHSAISYVALRNLSNHIHRFDLELESEADALPFRFKLLPWGTLLLPNDLGGRGRRIDADWELKEAWMEWQSTHLDLRFGNQIFTWGAADQINPTDVLNALDYRDPFLSPRPKVPHFALTAKLHPESTPWLNIEIVATAFTRFDKLPVEIPQSGQPAISVGLDQSRWLIVLPSSVASSGFQVPLYYRMAPIQNDPSRWSLGARTTFTDISGWDFSLMGFTGVERVPRFTVSLSGQPSDPNLPITVTLLPSVHRTSVLGFDGTTSFKLFERELGFRFESAFLLRSNAETMNQADLVKDPVFHSVIGFDHTFPENILGSVLYLNIQFVVYEKLGQTEQITGQGVLSGLPSLTPWDRNWVFYMENRFTDSIKLATRCVWSLRNGDLYLNPLFRWQFIDAASLSVGADMFFGGMDGFFGQLKENSRTIATLNFEF